MTTTKQRLTQELAIRRRQAARLRARLAAVRARAAKVRAAVIKLNRPQPTLRQRALAEAGKLVDLKVTELGGNNRGPWVEKIINYAGGDIGEPWCVDFVIWCYGHAGSRIVKPGTTRAVSSMFRAGLHQTMTPAPGDIVRYRFDHTGIFVKWISSTTFLAYEGNTGNYGAVSDSITGGDGVKEKCRHVSDVNDFLVVTA